jgi:hypothetical protein
MFPIEDDDDDDDDDDDWTHIVQPLSFIRVDFKQTTMHSHDAP